MPTTLQLSFFCLNKTILIGKLKLGCGMYIYTLWSLRSIEAVVCSLLALPLGWPLLNCFDFWRHMLNEYILL